MIRSIADAAKATGVPASTLRYYDREGLLPDVERLNGGSRVFSDDDLSWIRVIEHLKRAGLTIKEIRRYTDLVQQGNETLSARRDLIHERRQAVEAELARVQGLVDFLGGGDALQANLVAVELLHAHFHGCGSLLLTGRSMGRAGGPRHARGVF